MSDVYVRLGTTRSAWMISRWHLHHFQWRHLWIHDGHTNHQCPPSRHPGDACHQGQTDGHQWTGMGGMLIIVNPFHVDCDKTAHVLGPHLRSSNN